MLWHRELGMAVLLSKHFLNVEKQKNLIGFSFFFFSILCALRIVSKSVYFCASVPANF